ncbi:MAG: glycoside hydrolase family 127 protein [Deltaproteobacteria bacterium]|nr:glycoside hydrolase family 127 protein [Deltaproteobacteria bacterium]
MAASPITWVNLYIPGELTLTHSDITVSQKGKAAAGEDVAVTVVNSDKTKPITLFPRIPRWVSDTATVKVNGEVMNDAISKDACHPATGRWKSGDNVTLTLPAALRLIRTRDDSKMVSVFYGPVLLAGEPGIDTMSNDLPNKDTHLDLASINVPDIANSSSAPADWLESINNSPLAYKAKDTGPATSIIFRPFCEVHHQRYFVYWKLQPAK